MGSTARKKNKCKCLCDANRLWNLNCSLSRFPSIVLRVRCQMKLVDTSHQKANEKLMQRSMRRTQKAVPQKDRRNRLRRCLAALQPKRTIYDHVRLLWYRINYDFTRHSTTVFLKNFKTLRHQRLLAVCSARNQPQPVKLRQRLKHHGRMRKWLYFAAWKIRRSAGVGQRSRNDSIVVRRASDWSGPTWKAVKILTLAPRNKTSRATRSHL